MVLLTLFGSNWLVKIYAICFPFHAGNLKVSTVQHLQSILGKYSTPLTRGHVCICAPVQDS